MAKRVVVLQPPIDIPSGVASYQLPDKDALVLGDTKLMTLVADIIRNGHTTGTATITFQMSADTDPSPYVYQGGSNTFSWYDHSTTISLTSSTASPQRANISSDIGNLLRWKISGITGTGFTLSITALLWDV